MTTPARERTPFNNPHAAPRRLSTTDMAEMLRDGATQAEVAEAFGMVWHSVRDRLIDGGWGINGQPIDHRIHLAPLVPTPDLAWQDRAECRQYSPNVCHPRKGGSSRPGKWVCDRCDVTGQCLAWALSLPKQPSGVWGNTTEVERRQMRAAMAKEEAS